MFGHVNKKFNIEVEPSYVHHRGTLSMISSCQRYSSLDVYY